MRAIITCCLCLLFLTLFCPPVQHVAPLGVRDACASGTAPRFNWSSFLFFWNKNSPDYVKLKNLQEVSEGYFCDFGHTVSVTVLMNKDYVRGVRIRYTGGPGYDKGGSKFVKLINHAIKIGTFRWPDEIIRDVYEHYRTISKTTRDFSYQNTFFRMEYADGPGWTFGFMYLDK